MRQKLVQRYVRLVRGRFWKEPLQAVSRGELAFRLEEQDARGRELLDDRAHVEERARGNGESPRLVGQSVSLTEDDAVRVGDEHGTRKSEVGRAREIAVETLRCGALHGAFCPRVRRQRADRHDLNRQYDADFTQ